MSEKRGGSESLIGQLRNSFEYRTGMRVKRRRFPKTAQELKSSSLYNGWWYYSVELMPDMIAQGIYPPDLPMLPRMMLKRCELAGMTCLDLGSMEGLMPVLMRRGGARAVLATDAIPHCTEKMDAVQHYYGVDFDYKSVGLMYDLGKKLGGRGFDLINCSGLLYHVFSPLLVLAGMRSLLKKNGLLIVSTNVILDDSYRMTFNNAGRMQPEGNTFWYTSAKLLDYLLRYLKLAPLECLFFPHTEIRSNVKYVFNETSGYLSVLCRAVDHILPTRDDEWMAESEQRSWEHRELVDWKQAERQPASDIKYRGQIDRRYMREDIDCIDLSRAVEQGAPVLAAEQGSESHILRLADKS
jgi:2-polyprenyl-3-methyl-5-hydroxy-6-metoxy-1,4-benzoquinol methylase